MSSRLRFTGRAGGSAENGVIVLTYNGVYSREFLNKAIEQSNRILVYLPEGFRQVGKGLLGEIQYLIEKSYPFEIVP